MKRSAAAALVLLLVLGLYGCGGKPSSTDTDFVEPGQEPVEEQVQEPAEEPAQETLYVVHGDETVELYYNQVWAEFYEDGEWLTADGISAVGSLPEIADELPAVELGPDDALSFRVPEGTELNAIDVYDSEVELVHDDLSQDEFLTQVGSLQPATYYVVANSTRTGEYIESEDRYNKYGEEYLFKLVIGTAAE